MQELAKFRTVRVDAECSKFPEPIGWEQPTTRTDEEMLDFAKRVVSRVCAHQGGPVHVRHDISVSEISQASTGSRRG